MGPLSQLSSNEINTIKDSYIKNIKEPSQYLTHINNIIREKTDLIKTFAPKSYPAGLSLATIDGGNAKEKLSGGDLIVAGAALSEGAHSEHMYDEESFPSALYMSIIPPSSITEKIEKTARSLLELQVLAECNTNIKIIDGDYLGNTSTVLYGFLEENPIMVQELTKILEDDKNNFLIKAFKEILIDPEKGIWNGLVAIPKSDSAKIYVSKYLSEYNISSYTDRLFASSILKPGEFFTPRTLETNNSLINILEKKKKDKTFLNSLPQQVAKLLEDKAEALRRLGSGVEYGVLWTTYFKPTNWLENSGVLKVEFALSPNTGASALEHTEHVIQLIDNDIIDYDILEPLSQYGADVRAKEVSSVITGIKNLLLEQAETPRDFMGLIKGYRT